MKIPYSNKPDKREILIGLFYVLIGGGWAVVEPETFLSYFFLFTGLLYFASVLYRKKYAYLKVEHGKLKKSDIIPKQITISEIVRIKEFAGDYTLYTSQKKMKIHYHWINKNSRKEFKDFIKSLNPEIEHTTKKVSSFSHH